MDELFEAVVTNNIGKVKKILTNRLVPVNVRNTDDERTALHVAALNGYPEMIKVLVDDFDADVNARDKNGDVPCSLAANCQHFEITKFLIERESIVPESVHDLLLQFNEKVALLIEAAKHNDLTSMQRMAKLVNINVRDEKNKQRTALHVASREGHIDMVKYLVEELGADMGIEDTNGDVALNIAADCYNVPLVKYFISQNSPKSSDVQPMLNDDKTSEFFEAVRQNNITKVSELLKSEDIKDANVVDKENYHRTALHTASADGNEDLVKLLVIEFHAKMDICDEFGELPVHNAKDNDHDSVAKFLMEHNNKMEGDNISQQTQN